MHSLPGGVYTSWTRKGYIFDGCLHHLAGCLPDHGLHRVWQELGAMPRPILHAKEIVQVEAPGGKRLTVHAEADLLEQHLLDLAPGDAKPIGEYLRAARACRKFDLMDLAVSSPGQMLKALPVILSRARWMNVTMADAGRCFRNPFIRRAFPTLQYDSPANPMAMFLNMPAQCETRNFGWPQGGSLAFARDIAGRYLDLGGVIHYRARVDKVLVENDRAVGVRLADGGEHRADVVVSNAYGRATVMDLVDLRSHTVSVGEVEEPWSARWRGSYGRRRIVIWWQGRFGMRSGRGTTEYPMEVPSRGVF